MIDTSIPVPTNIRRVDDEDIGHLRHIRLYPAGPTWASLQIRGRSAVTQSGRGKVWSWWSSAHLDYTAAVELRTALTDWIEDQRVAAG